jgi:hypothetical protein
MPAQVHFSVREANRTAAAEFPTQPCLDLCPDPINAPILDNVLRSRGIGRCDFLVSLKLDHPGHQFNSRSAGTETQGSPNRGKVSFLP